MFLLFVMWDVSICYTFVQLWYYVPSKLLDNSAMAYQGAMDYSAKEECQDPHGKKQSAVEVSRWYVSMICEYDMLLTKYCTSILDLPPNKQPWKSGGTMNVYPPLSAS